VSVKNVAVIGAGTMGAGIAQLAAEHGCAVHLIEVNRDVLRQALAAIGERLSRAVAKGKLSGAERDAVLRRIHAAESIHGLQDVAIAIEAVVEDLSVKQTVFAELESATDPSAVLATNTSSLSITRIAKPARRPGRIIGMHFFNPAPIMPLVEVVAGEQSDESAITAAMDTAKSWGKVPVRVKDTPGFIVNRVARGFYLEALRLLGEGVAGVDETDNIMRRHGKFKMGPFELMDLVGLDVNYSVSCSVWEQMGKPTRLEPHEIQRKLVEAGHLGRKTGRGFYSYDDGGPLPACPVERRSFGLSPLLSDVMLAFSGRAGAVEATSTEQYVFCRILGAVINEAGLACSDGVASAADIDVAMQKGTNYPKGPLAWADEIGPRTVRGLLKALNSLTADGRYQPAPLFA